MSFANTRLSLLNFAKSILPNSCPQRFLSSIQEKYLDDLCICVDEQDRELRNVSKRECHKIETMSLHRAFSVFLFTPDEKLLLQKRSKYKVTFPSVWTNSCCSHPLWTEAERCQGDDAIGVRRAAQRKLKHELGIHGIPLSDMHVMGRFIYKAVGNNGWGEHELDYAVVIPNFNVGDIKVNSDEVEEVACMDRANLKRFVESKEAVSPWFSLFLSQHYLHIWWDNLKDLPKLRDWKTIHRLN